MTTYCQIHNEDCLIGVPKIQDKSIDLIVTSPPYNCNLGNNKYHHLTYDIYKDDKTHEEYLNWLCEIFFQFKKKLKVGGRVAINIVDTYGGKIPIVNDICHFMTHILGYLPMGNIIWNKNNIQSRCSWGSWQSPSCPSLLFSYEYILLFANENRKIQYKGETDLSKEEFLKYVNSLWTIAPEGRSKKKFNHPAAFPVELPKRLIKLLTWKDSLIVDPFMGVGSTAVASKELGRNFIGFEISPEYCETAKRRILDVRN